MRILIIKGTSKLPNGNRNAKEYPYWDKLLELLKEHEIKEINSILTSDEIKELVNWSDIWISVDSFLPHFVAYHRQKKGIVLWGKSDPLIFGYTSNINLLKDRKYLRTEQFRWWNDEPYDEDVFVHPEVILQSIENMV